MSNNRNFGQQRKSNYSSGSGQSRHENPGSSGRRNRPQNICGHQRFAGQKAISEYWPTASEEAKSALQNPHVPDCCASSAVSGFAPKLAPGKDGEKIDLLSNCFCLRLKFEMRIHHYDVTIEAQEVQALNSNMAAAVAVAGPRRRARKLNKHINRLVINKMINQNGKSDALFSGIFAVYDSDKILYTLAALSSKSVYAIDEDNVIRFRVPVEVIEEEGERPQHFIVTLKEVGTLHVNPNAALHPPEVVQFIDIAVRFGPTSNKIPIGSKLFKPQGQRKIKELQGNKELAYGHYQSARQMKGGLMLNVDFSTCVFHIGGNIVDVFNRCLKDDVYDVVRILDKDIRKMAAELRGLRFRVTHLDYPFKRHVDDITLQAATELTFPWSPDNDGDDLNEISVCDYFAMKYNKKLSFPNFPSVVVRNRDRSNYFPLEVCKLLPDQYIYGKLPPNLQKEVSYILGKQRPNERFQQIEYSARSIKKAGHKFLKHFGFEIISDGFLPVKGRVLQPPHLRFKRNDQFQPVSGSWTMQKNPKKEFLEGVNVKNWIMVDISRSYYDQRSQLYSGFTIDFKRELIKIGKEVGITIANIDKNHVIKHFFRNFECLKENVFQWAKNNIPNLQLIVAIIPDQTEIYKAVKKLGDHDFGIATQCVSTKHYRRDEEFPKLLSTTYLTNLSLKINAKLNGVNTALNMNVDSKHVMFVGIDVSHPPPGRQRKYSIASCVASYDETYVRYYAKSSVQEKTRKEIVEIDVFMRELLEKYNLKNHQYPERVIVYRDGVSEGEFAQLQKSEIAALVSLFEELSISKMTYIVVQKRHNIRFINAYKAQAIGSGNIPAGTVIDTVVTHPTLFSFFLCSQHGLLGTSRPALYTVLYDTNKFTADQIQRITFYNTFLLARSTRSVSLPAPVIYADLSAFRARQNLMTGLEEELDGDEEEQISNDELRELNELLKANESIESMLYYI